jgi:hypothetical protein
LIGFFLQLKINLGDQTEVPQVAVKDDISVHSVERVEEVNLRDPFEHLNTRSLLNDPNDGSDFGKSEESSINTDRLTTKTGTRTDSQGVSVKKAQILQVLR